MVQVSLRPRNLATASGGLSPAAALVRRHDRDRFQTALFAPPAEREALLALYAFNYEIARVRESVREPMLGQIRLQWWREAVDTAYSGTTPRRHAVVEAVTAAVRTRRLSKSHFDRLIDAREHDFDADPPATLAGLEDYAEASSAPLVLLALQTLDAADPAVEEVGRHVGIAYALSGILRALPHAAQAGRSLLPGGSGARVDARDGRALRDAVAEIAAAASGHLAAARARRQAVPARALPALLPARVASRALRRLETARFDPFAPGIADRDPLQPWRLAAAMLFRRF